MIECRALENAFRRISATRMADMPLRNSALAVEAVEFREWEGRLVGVLVTPWSMSLVVLPRAGAGSRALRLDERQQWRFPSGDYEFMGGAEPECGTFQFCSLFSPPTEIADQEQAREVARAVMQQLFQPTALSRRALLGASAPAAQDG